MPKRKRPAMRPKRKPLRALLAYTPRCQDRGITGRQFCEQPATVAVMENPGEQWGQRRSILCDGHADELCKHEPTAERSDLEHAHAVRQMLRYLAPA